MFETTIDIADILCEFFEIAVHNYIYSRKLYPDCIFEPKRKYGIVVYHSIHPDVNSYIQESLKAVHFHMKKSQLKQLIVSIQVGDHIFENMLFDINKAVSNFESDPYLVRFEQNLRDFCLKLHSTTIYEDSLPSDANFAIKLCTTELSNIEFNDIPCYENFPWIQCSQDEALFQAPDIVPIINIENHFLNMQIYLQTPCID